MVFLDFFIRIQTVHLATLCSKPKTATTEASVKKEKKKIIEKNIKMKYYIDLSA